MSIFQVKQTKLIRPPKGEVLSDQKRPPNIKYVYTLTSFICLGSFLFGWNQGVLSMIIADARWLKIMEPANDWTIGFVVSIYNIGCAFGAMTVGFLADSVGRERTISLASIVFITGALLQAASYTVTQMTLGRLVLGVGVGAYSAGVPLYITEIAPAAIRGRIGAINLMILCFAEMVVFFVVYGFFFMNSDNWWRYPITIQILPAIVLAVGCWIWVPPSPRWLVAQDRYDCAHEVLSRLHGTDVADFEIKEIRESLSIEDASSQGTWADMLKGPVRWVTFLGTTIQFLQQITGTNSIFYYAPTLFMRGGLTAEAANLATAGVGVVLFFSAWIPVVYFDRLGRKTWLQIGTAGMFGALIGIAALLRHAESHPGSPTNNAIVAFPYLFYTFFNMSWSSGSWTYAAEIFPISLRAKGNALCTASLWISNFIVAQTTPPIASAIGWGLYILLAFFCLIAFLFVRYALVETKGRTLEEMSHLFGLNDEAAKQDHEDSERNELLRNSLDSTRETDE
ncbi:permease of the major facilitator superfamily [Truncatella angustata]|uniref:Permease of the major facilitator superfamily n=1 Tax=Truncatella angustata TaxID=152316 RepID=A0A9P8UI24_9PEZI|nr:permease of the major facilitator superfamily [Truncatella angustata]KAH6652554.1 permease of the major facilitator superfamily [Truncatella angustata]